MATFQKIISEDSNGVVSVSSKLGVGTSSPDQTVDIRGQLVIDNWIRGWQSPSDHTYGRYWMNFNSGSPIFRTSHDNNYHKFQRYSGDDVMIVGGANKRVGIGASSPRGRLDVLGTWGSQGFYVSDYGGAVYLPTDIGHSSGAGTFDIQVRNYRLGTTTGGDISIYPKHGTNSIGLGTSSYQNQFFISGVNGRIGIGTTSPTKDFHVAGEIMSTGNLSVQKSFPDIFTFSDDEGRIGFADSGGAIQSGMKNASGDLLLIADGNTERVRVNSTGVGIGETSPDSPLHLTYADNTTSTTATGTGQHDYGVKIENTSTTTGAFSQLHLRAGTADGYIRHIYNNTNDGRLGFFVDNTNDVKEAFSILNDGKIGIGTSSPEVLLHLDSSSTSELRIQDGTNLKLRIKQQNNGAFLTAETGNSLTFTTNGNTTAMHIDTSQRIGMGTTSPTEKLHVVGNISLPLDASNTSYKLKLTGSSTSEIYGSAYDAYFSTALNHYFVSRDGFVHRSSDSSKQIFFKHDVNSVHHISSNMSDFQFLAGASTGGFGFLTNGNTTTYVAIKPIYTNNSNSGLKFNTKASGTDTERMRITSDGKVGIGSTAPAHPLHVDGNLYLGRISANSTNSILFHPGSGGSYPYMDVDSAGRFDIKIDGTNAMSFSENGGGVGIGTTTPSEKLEIAVTDNNTAFSFNRATVADNNWLGKIEFKGNNGTETHTYSQIHSVCANFEDGAEYSDVKISGSNGSNGLEEIAQFYARQIRMPHNNSRIGIGTTSPLHSLHTRENIMAGSDGTIRGVFSAGNDGSGNYLYAGMKGGDSTTAVKFGVYLNSGLAEQGYIAISNQNGGRVGVNTTSPTAQFHVNNTTDTTSARFSTSNTLNYIHLTNAGGANHYIQTNQHGLALSADENDTRGSIQLKTSNTTRLQVASDGKVGIGLTSPVTTLHVHSATTGSNFIHVTNNTSGSGANDGMEFGLNGAHGYVWNRENASLYFGTNDTTRMTIVSDGKVGIGDTNPQGSLHVEKIGSNAPILFNDGYYGYALGSGSLPSAIDPNSNSFAMYMSSTRLHMVTTHSSGQFRWLNGSSNRRMTLDNNGRLGIGLNVDPNKPLHVEFTDAQGTIAMLRGGAFSSVEDRPVGITYSHSVSGNHYAWYLGTKYENSTNEGYNGRRFTLGVKVSDGHHADLTNDTYSLVWWNQSDSSANFAGSILANPNADSTHVFGRASIHSVSSDYATFSHYDQRTSGVGYALRQYYTGATALNSAGGQRIDFKINNDTKAVLNGDNFGIGTTSPSYKLDLVNGGRINRASNDPYLIFARDGTSLSQIRGVDGGGINITDGSSSNSRIYVNSSGNVGIAETNPSTTLDVGGSLKVQSSAEFQDTVTFEGDVDLTNSSIEGLPSITVSPTTIFKCATTATNINFGVSLTKGDILFGTPSSENSTYIGHIDNDEQITLKRAGEYEISVTLVVTAQSASNRFTCLTYVEHYNSSNTLLDSFGLEAMYIRSNGSNYNSGAMAGQIRITTTSVNSWIKVTSMVLDRESTGTVPLNTTYSKIRIDKIDYNQ